MNSIIKNTYDFEMYQALRIQLMDILSDEDLSFQPSPQNPTLGALCKEIGEAEHTYIESFKSFSMDDFTYRNDEPGLADSVEKLVTWYELLDAQLKAAISTLTDEDIANKTIDRGGGFVIPANIQLEISTKKRC